MEREIEEQLLYNITKVNFRNYQNQQTSIWHRLPVSRRSSVFILVFLGKLGELRVVLTKRSSRLRNFPGHISLPGGKADNGLESEWHVSRREMFEEIGLDSDNKKLKDKYGFTIDHLNILPCYLSRTFSAVRPCVGFMKFEKHINDSELASRLKISLNPGESSSIFSCPLKDFVYPTIKEKSLESIHRTSHKVKWGGIPWNLRSYTFYQRNDSEVDWLREIGDLSASEEESESGTASETPKAKVDLTVWGRLGSRRDSETNEKIYDVWGLTANILHDLAKSIYCIDSQGELGEEELIYSIWKYGNQMQFKDRSEDEIKLINSNSTPGEFGFRDILPRSEFLRLKQLYKL